MENSPRHHEWDDVKTDSGRTVRCFVAFPEVKGPATTLVVIHENRGLDDWARSFADQVAEAGYLAIAPDLLSGTAPGGGGTAEYGSTDAARQGIYKLPTEQVREDLAAVFAFAKRQSAGNGKVAVAGFCWGGGQSFAHAGASPHVAAACVFYGTAPGDDATYEAIRAPVYGFYGGDDHRITGAVPAVAKKMEQLDKPYSPVIYEGAGHAFMRRGETEPAGSANHQAREQAWAKLKQLLKSLDGDQQP
ncbi:MAG: dienelactone hydrolase family protein [Planctomycetales bacterium]|nr:dienelactone hydrolase family protein [Planctomycetales bacterium]